MWGDGPTGGRGLDKPTDINQLPAYHFTEEKK